MTDLDQFLAGIGCAAVVVLIGSGVGAVVVRYADWATRDPVVTSDTTPEYPPLGSTNALSRVTTGSHNTMLGYGALAEKPL